ncbi:MAG TPA: thioredoxin-disulfide reductase [Bacteroidetes bacterium]|nr:thioredoxin-disulfide reductase [Ignavibacteria bacterium]HCA42874.1 thioredoxin-disulfide reductase [Bacteroidota bacterium]HCN36091.1 thioredoxin-disulfide reductase [Bacteroidota bacterium]
MSNHHKVIIIGSGPAGFTAALYAARANLKPIIFEGNQPGGQLMITTEVENYPGFEHGIQGPELMDVMRKQVHRFGAESIYKYIVKVDFSSKPFKLWTDDGTEYTCDTCIVSTGATAKLLGLESENTFMGYGVSACATCDGFFFKNQRVVVVGGGDTAMEEANYLTHHASEVTIIHRRDEFRASKIMLDRAKKNPKIKFVTDTVIEEILGKEENGRKTVTGIKIKNMKSGEESVLECEGVFVAIGHKPNTDIFKGILDMDDVGYLITKKSTTETNIEGVFACGDAQDSYYRQAVTAAGTGCMAAIDAERYLERINS